MESSRDHQSNPLWAPFLLLFAGLSLLSAQAQGQTGVSEDRVSLPEGPGSLEGVGENLSINPNMGTMTYGANIALPSGFASVTPNLDLSYSSGAGGSVVGMGWSMPMPSIERMTYRRLPEYNEDDDFHIDGTQLVKLPGTNPPVYRARFEGGFARYTWMGAEGEDSGYWRVETPDGTQSYYGADQTGTLVENARVGEEEGTFRYHLVEKVDVYGHRETWTYQKFGNYALPTQIAYVYTDDTPSYRAELTYEERRDETGVEYLSDGAPGFDLLLTQRLSKVEVFSHNIQIRTYHLNYESYENSGGFTRLARFSMTGRNGGLFPVVQDFEYSQALGGVCQGDSCQQPFTVDMGSLGVGLAAGNTTLVDMNGDGLPDVVDTTQQGAHKFYLNIPSEDGRSSFQTTALESAVGTGSSHRLSTPVVQVLDVNGDGFTDLANIRTGAVLLNRGTGDWTLENFGASETAGNVLAEFETGEGPSPLRFLDYNNDKLIDIMRSSPDQTQIFENRGTSGFVGRSDIEQIGFDFQDANVELNDMNGDGLLDIVRLRLDGVSYRLNYGRGKWGPLANLDGMDVSANELPLLDLEDLNGDGMADLVLVNAGQIRYALNKNGESFGAPVTMTSESISGEIPNRDDTVSVLYADMNANGSSDIVWIDNSGNTTYLEIFPVRSNLLAKITNGIGRVLEVTYDTAAAQMARDGGRDAWTHALPYPMNVVAMTDVYDLQSNVHQMTRYYYHDGFYDGAEKQFRGFKRVEVETLGDAFHETGLTANVYDVGDTDTYRNGLLLTSNLSSNNRPLRTSTQVYEDCAVNGIPDNTEFPVRYLCATQASEVVQEGADESQWITTEKTMEYDGYGNVTKTSHLGVTSIGGGACEPCGNRDASDFGAPCGNQCLGDEAFTETQYITPDNTNGRWILHHSFRERGYGIEGSDHYTETLTYYDGEPFTGLPLGTLDKGDISRVTRKISADSDEVIERVRNRFDAHGMVLETLDPLGEPDGNTHRRTSTYDRDNLRVTQSDTHLETPDGTAYTARQTYRYDAAFDRLAGGSSWVITENDIPLEDPRENQYTYDEFGRLATRFAPGQTPSDAPVEEFTFDLQNPVSRIIARRRTIDGGELDIEAISCIDGHGRKYLTKERLADGTYQASSYQVYDAYGSVIRTYQNYLSNHNACETEPPNTAYASYTYDAMNRPLGMEYSDASIYGEASKNRTEYGPLTMTSYNAEDMDPESPTYNTPIITYYNGVNQKVALLRYDQESNDQITTQMHYDQLGRFVGHTDPQGNQKTQRYDLLDRIVQVEDPNTDGTWTYEYDHAGNTIRMMDERGYIVHVDYDGANRPTAQWDEEDPENTRIEFSYDRTAPGCDPLESTFAAWRLSGQSFPGPNGTRVYECNGFDIRNRPLVNSRIIQGTTFSNTYTHDNIDRMTSVTFPDGNTLTRELDASDRLLSVPGFVSSVGYEERGMVDTLECEDGTTTSTVYDDLLRITETTVSNGNEVLQGYAYTYNRLGHITSLEDLADDTNGLPPATANYQYDRWQRLTEATLNPNANQAETLTYAYNTIDNPTSRTSSLGAQSMAPTGTYAYTGTFPNAVTNFGNTAFHYDQSGQMTQRGEQTLTWDYRGRLTHVDSPTLTSSYTYDDSYNRVTRTENGSSTLYISDDFIVRDGISTLYVTVHGHKIARVQSDALATELYTDHNEDGRINAADALREDDAESTLWSSVRRLLMDKDPVFLHHDYRGSITLATQKDGNNTTVLGRRAYFPYGATRAEFGYTEAYGFIGKEQDATGLHHFESRYYDSNTGRWTRPDPAFHMASPGSVTSGHQGVNPFTYSTNDPVNKLDYNGFDTVTMAVGYTSDMNNMMSANYDSYIDKTMLHFAFGTNDTIIHRAPDAAGGLTLNQHDLTTPDSVLTLVGHGSTDTNRFGTNPSFGGQLYTAEQLVDLLISEGLTGTGGDLSGLEIRLHGCATGSKSAADGKNGQSFALKFAKALQARHFSNFKVVGYKGFVVGNRLGTIDTSTGEVGGDITTTNDPSAQVHFTDKVKRSRIGNKVTRSIQTSHGSQNYLHAGNLHTPTPHVRNTHKPHKAPKAKKK